MLRFVIGFVAAAAALFGVAAWAVEVDGARGGRLSGQWCANCHGIEPGEMQSPVRSAPSFAALAGSSAVTEMSLRSFLLTSHRNMPNIHLSPEQIDDIVAYVLGLRRH